MPQVYGRTSLTSPAGDAVVAVDSVEGEEHMVQNGGITDEDVADGWVLACCTRPLDPVA